MDRVTRDRRTGRRPDRDTAPVVALVLADGTVLTPEGLHATASEWSQGSVGGDGWVLWWQRRRVAGR